MVIEKFVKKYDINSFNDKYNIVFVKKYDINSFNDKYNIELGIDNITNLTIYSIMNNNSNSISWLILYNTLNSKL